MEIANTWLTCLQMSSLHQWNVQRSINTGIVLMSIWQFGDDSGRRFKFLFCSAALYQIESMATNAELHSGSHVDQFNDAFSFHVFSLVYQNWSLLCHHAIVEFVAVHWLQLVSVEWWPPLLRFHHFLPEIDHLLIQHLTCDQICCWHHSPMECRFCLAEKWLHRCKWVEILRQWWVQHGWFHRWPPTSRWQTFSVSLKISLLVL